MRSLILGAIAGTALLGTMAIAPSQAAVSADINIHLGRRAPAVYFAREPRVVVIPETEVYYVDDYDELGYDMYRCDDWWYINDGGDWYRSHYYRGPWVSISFSTLPRRILNVPIAYRHEPYRSQYWGRSYGGYDGRYQSSRRYDDGRSWSGRRYDDDRRNSDRWWTRRSGDGRDVRWRSDRSDRRDDDNWRNGRGNNGNGRGNGKGKGNGRGHGRGRGHGDDD